MKIHSEKKSSDESAVGNAGTTPVSVECPSPCCGKQRADRERRLEALAVEVLTALGERDGAVRDAQLRASGALLAITDDEGLSMREAVEWCGSGVTLREVTRLRRLADQHSGGSTG